MLTDAALKDLRPRKTYKVFDGDGMYWRAPYDHLPPGLPAPWPPPDRDLLKVWLFWPLARARGMH